MSAKRIEVMMAEVQEAAAAVAHDFDRSSNAVGYYSSFKSHLLACNLLQE
jgi:hypothetical protein